MNITLPEIPMSEGTRRDLANAIGEIVQTRGGGFTQGEDDIEAIVYAHGLSYNRTMGGIQIIGDVGVLATLS